MLFWGGGWLTWGWLLFWFPNPNPWFWGADWFGWDGPDEKPKPIKSIPPVFDGGWVEGICEGGGEGEGAGEGDGDPKPKRSPPNPELLGWLTTGWGGGWEGADPNPIKSKDWLELVVGWVGGWGGGLGSKENKSPVGWGFFSATGAGTGAGSSIDPIRSISPIGSFFGLFSAGLFSNTGGSGCLLGWLLEWWGLCPETKGFESWCSSFVMWSS